MLVLLFIACAVAGGACLIFGHLGRRRWVKRLGYVLVAVSVVIVASFVLAYFTTDVETVIGVIAL
jgi:type IV secretory pathway VirB2 component (pilin)